MSEQLAAGDCFTCTQTARGTDAPQRERVATTGHWRVAHAFNTSLPGWLVIVPRQHVLAFDELSIQACVELGPLVHDLTSALRECLGCTKTYLMQFSEAEGYSHLHLHLVPRMPDMPEEAKGPRCFTYLEVEESLRVPVVQVDLLAAALVESLASG